MIHSAILILVALLIVLMATDFIDPNTDVATSGWTGVPDNTDLYNNVDNGVRDPDTDSIDSDYNQTSGDGNSLEHGLTATGGTGTVTAVKAVIRCVCGDGNDYFQLGVNGVSGWAPSDQDVSAPGTSPIWRSVEWTSLSIPRGNFDSAEIEIMSMKSGKSGALWRVHEGYLELTFTPPVTETTIQKTSDFRVLAENTIPKNADFRVLVENTIQKTSDFRVLVENTIPKTSDFRVLAEETIQKNADFRVLIQDNIIQKTADFTVVIATTIQKASDFRVLAEETIPKTADLRVLGEETIQKTADFRVSVPGAPVGDNRARDWTEVTASHQGVRT